MPFEASVVVSWKQVSMGNMVLDNWVATMVAPVTSMEFAIVCRQDNGWQMELFPKGRIIDNPRTYTARYASREKAQAHVERWARYHWHTVRSR